MARSDNPYETPRGRQLRRTLGIKARIQRLELKRTYLRELAAHRQHRPGKSERILHEARALLSRARARGKAPALSALTRHPVRGAAS